MANIDVNPTKLNDISQQMKNIDKALTSISYELDQLTGSLSIKDSAGEELRKK